MSCALCHFGFEFCQRQRSCDLALVSCVNNVFFPLLPVAVAAQFGPIWFVFIGAGLGGACKLDRTLFFFFLIIII